MPKCRVILCACVQFIALLALVSPCSAQPGHTETAETKIVRVAPGRPARVEFRVEASAIQIGGVVKAAKPGIRLSIEAPGGRRIDQKTAPALGGHLAPFECDGKGGGFLGPCPDGAYVLFEAPSLGAGAYIFTLEPADTLAREIEVEVTFSWSRPMTADETQQHKTSLQLKTSFSLSPVYDTAVLGKSSRLTVTATLQGSPLIGADVTAEVRPEQGVQTSLVLTDEGTGADQSAGDGLYTAWFTPQALGRHAVEAIIHGQASEGSRLERIDFEVVPFYAEFTGSFSDRGIDENADGRIEKIAIHAEIDVKEAGKYAVLVFLSKEPVVLERSHVNLQPGRQIVPVAFDVFEIEKAGLASPYQIASAEITHYGESGARDIEILENVGFTQSYAAENLAKAPFVVLLDEITDRGLDEDGDGRFDWLVVAVPIELNPPRGVEWRAELWDSPAAEMEWVQDFEVFEQERNLIELKFRGDLVNRSKGGGLLIRNFRLSGGDRSLEYRDLYTTQEYAPTQFRVSQPRVVSMTPGEAVRQGEEAHLLIETADTNFKAMEPIQVSFGPGITVESPMPNSQTSIGVSLNVAPDAALGPRTVTIVAGEERFSFENALTIVRAE